ncbi:hypothetical protein PR048_032740 [Dryococelus australis]|uniref:Uncharacterized protein n=1 Tax=Dryococelus australis TaxID=614101 RepID=A0ABQ9G677_9NEOP|nr:hypothetical protein PR048_032740 [Dryococelus australis]
MHQDLNQRAVFVCIEQWVLERFPVLLLAARRFLKLGMPFPFCLSVLASHKGKPGSIPDGVAPGFSHVRIVSDDAFGRRVSSGISRFPHPFILTLLHTHLASPTSALKTSMLRAAQISPLYSLTSKFFRDQQKAHKRIEHAWAKLKTAVCDRPQTPETLPDLIRAAQMEWVLRPEDDITTLFTSMPRRVRDLYNARGGHTRRLLWSRGGGAAIAPRHTQRRTGFFDFRRGRSRTFVRGNTDGRRRWSAGFLRDLPFTQSLHSGAVSCLTLNVSQDPDVPIAAHNHPLHSHLICMDQMCTHRITRAGGSLVCMDQVSVCKVGELVEETPAAVGPSGLARPRSDASGKSVPRASRGSTSPQGEGEGEGTIFSRAGPRTSDQIMAEGAAALQPAAALPKKRDWGRNGKESAMAFVRDPYQHSSGVISGNHGKPKQGWQDRESNPAPPECESTELPLHYLAHLVRYRVGSGVVWTNRTIVSSNTDANRTGVLAVVDIDYSLLISLECHQTCADGPRWCSGQTTLLPPRRAGLDSWHGHSWIFASEKSCQMMPLVGGFSQKSMPFSRLSIPMPFHTRLASSSSALETSIYTLRGETPRAVNRELIQKALDKSYPSSSSTHSLNKRGFSFSFSSLSLPRPLFAIPLPAPSFSKKPPLRFGQPASCN